MRAAYILAFIAIAFVLTYNPKSGGIEKYILKPAPVDSTGVREVDIAAKVHSKEPGCCSNNNYMANNVTQCEYPHYQGVQFADSNYGCPERLPPAWKGAIL